MPSENSEPAQSVMAMVSSSKLWWSGVWLADTAFSKNPCRRPPQGLCRVVLALVRVQRGITQPVLTQPPCTGSHGTPPLATCIDLRPAQAQAESEHVSEQHTSQGATQGEVSRTCRLSAAHHMRKEPRGLHEAQEAAEQQDQGDGQLHGGLQQRHSAAGCQDRVETLRASNNTRHQRSLIAARDESRP